MSPYESIVCLIMPLTNFNIEYDRDISYVYKFKLSYIVPITTNKKANLSYYVY